MANDYHLFIANWTSLMDHFENSSLGNIEETDWAKLDIRHRAQNASEFLQFAWESDFSIPLDNITPFHSASGSFHLWCALGATYSEVRRFLPEVERDIYDALYLPFIAPWVEEIKEKDHPFELPSKLKERLMPGGLYLALSPERCRTMRKDFWRYSFSRLVHVALASRSLPPPLPGAFSFFHSLLDGAAKLDHLHANYTQATEGWHILTSQANHRNWGIIAIYDI